MQHFFAEPVSSSVLGRPGEKDLLGRPKGMERKVTPVSPYVSSQLVTGPRFHQPVCPERLTDTFGFSLEYMQVTCPYFVCSMSSIPFILPYSPPPLHLPCLLERHKLDAELSLLCCGNELWSCVLQNLVTDCGSQKDSAQTLRSVSLRSDISKTSETQPLAAFGISGAEE